MFIASIAIIGDEASKIKVYIEQMYKSRCLLVPCNIEVYTPENFPEALVHQSYDLVILDIFLSSGVDGLTLAKQITTNSDTDVIVMSGYVDGLPKEQMPPKIRFINKPITYDRLQKSIICWQQNLRQRYNSFAFIQARLKKTVLLQDILYIEAHEKALFLMCKDNIQYKFYGQLNLVEQELEQFNFLRCHRSFIVNMQYIIAINTENDRCGQFILALPDNSTISIPISSRRMSKVLAVYRTKIGKCLERME